MRTEKEMFDLLISIAQSDERIRAVYLNGSRTNPNVPKDIFQDYDVVYVVTETKPFIVIKIGLTDSAKSCLCNFLTNTLIIQAIRIISTVG